MYFQWAQLRQTIPNICKNRIKQNLSKNESDLLALNHDLIKIARILTLGKLTAKKMYSILISSLKIKPNSQNYFGNLFQNYTFGWNQRNSQYEILHNILYVSKKLYIFQKLDSSFCSICHWNDEPVAHLFCECVCARQL